MNLLNFIGVGTVVENKDSNSPIIKFSLKKEFPQSDGEVTAIGEMLSTKFLTPKYPTDAVANKQRIDRSFPTQQTSFHTSKVMETNWYTAKWMGLGGNRITSPDVIVGSPVAIYKFSDDDEYLWTTWGIGTESMRLEHVIYAWNADPSLNKDRLFSFDNFYTLIVSTRDGSIQLRTSQKNGEKVAYDLKLNTRESKWYFKDTERNAFALDSLGHTWIMRNWEESIFTISRENIGMTNKGTTTIHADKKIDIKTTDMIVNCDTFTLTAKNTLNMNTAALTVNADATTWTSETIDITSPISNVNGNVNVAGNLGVGGGISCFSGPGGGGGAMVSEGPIECKDVITCKDIIVGGISFLKHDHTDSNGGDCSPPK